MKKGMIKSIAAALVLALFVSTALCLPTYAAPSGSAADAQKEINKLEQQSKEIEKEISGLKSQINKQNELKAALDKKIAVIEQQIAVCNREISKINTTINENRKQIKQKNDEIEADKLAFKKRLRAIYMSGSDSDIKILLGAEDFSQFLALSQLTASVSARDKLMIEKIVAAVKELEAKQEENNRLLEEQNSIKSTAVAKQQQLEAENSQVQSVINEISGEQNKLNQKNADIEKNIKQYQNYIASLAVTSGSGGRYDGSKFLWPVSGYYYLSAVFNGNDSIHKGSHNGVDIAGGGIMGKPILAIADGVVTYTYNGCTHNTRGYMCTCGQTYGNHVKIDHGKSDDGKIYGSLYAHMTSTAVSAGQRVKKGQVIGYVGTTGYSTGPHLHFSVSVNSHYVNPMQFYSSVK